MFHFRVLVMLSFTSVVICGESREEVLLLKHGDIQHLTITQGGQPIEHTATLKKPASHLAVLFVRGSQEARHEITLHRLLSVLFSHSARSIVVLCVGQNSLLPIVQAQTPSEPPILEDLETACPVAPPLSLDQVVASADKLYSGPPPANWSFTVLLGAVSQLDDEHACAVLRRRKRITILLSATETLPVCSVWASGGGIATSTEALADIVTSRIPYFEVLVKCRSSQAITIRAGPFSVTGDICSSASGPDGAAASTEQASSPRNRGRAPPGRSAVPYEQQHQRSQLPIALPNSVTEATLSPLRGGSVTTSGVPPRSSPTAPETNQLARLVSQRDYAGAIKAAQSLLSDTDDWQVYSQLSLAYRRTGNIELARSTLKLGLDKLRRQELARDLVEIEDLYGDKAAAGYAALAQSGAFNAGESAAFMIRSELLKVRDGAQHGPALNDNKGPSDRYGFRIPGTLSAVARICGLTTDHSTLTFEDLLHQLALLPADGRDRIDTALTEYFRRIRLLQRAGVEREGGFVVALDARENGSSHSKIRELITQKAIGVQHGESTTLLSLADLLHISESALSIQASSLSFQSEMVFVPFAESLSKLASPTDAYPAPLRALVRQRWLAQLWCVVVGLPDPISRAFVERIAVHSRKDALMERAFANAPLFRVSAKGEAYLPGQTSSVVALQGLVGAKRSDPVNLWMTLLQVDDGQLLLFVRALAALDPARVRVVTRTLPRLQAIYERCSPTIRSGDWRPLATLLQGLPLDDKGELLLPGSPAFWITLTKEECDISAKVPTGVDQHTHALLNILRCAETATGAWVIGATRAIAHLQHHHADTLDTEAVLALVKTFRRWPEAVAAYSYWPFLEWDEYRFLYRMLEQFETPECNAIGGVHTALSIVKLISIMLNNGSASPEATRQFVAQAGMRAVARVQGCSADNTILDFVRWAVSLPSAEGADVSPPRSRFLQTLYPTALARSHDHMLVDAIRMRHDKLVDALRPGGIAIPGSVTSPLHPTAEHSHAQAVQWASMLNVDAAAFMVDQDASTVDPPPLSDRMEPLLQHVSIQMQGPCRDLPGDQAARCWDVLNLTRTLDWQMLTPQAAIWGLPLVSKLAREWAITFSGLAGGGHTRPIDTRALVGYREDDLFQLGIFLLRTSGRSLDGGALSEVDSPVLEELRHLKLLSTESGRPHSLFCADRVDYHGFGELSSAVQTCLDAGIDANSCRHAVERLAISK